MSASSVGALAALATALALWPPAGTAVSSRLRALHPHLRRLPAARAPAIGGRGAAAMGHAGDGGARRRWLLAAAAGVGVALVLGGPAGAVGGAALAVAGERVLRRADTGADAERQATLARDLPVACDLLAVCLTAGLPLSGALAAVASAVPRPLGGHLAAVAALYRLGAEPRHAWADVPGELAVLARVVIRAGESGSAAVPALRAMAVDARSSARAAAEAAVRRAGVWVLAPLGLCFLPAFVCLGVAPLVLGIARDVFG